MNVFTWCNTVSKDELKAPVEEIGKDIHCCIHQGSSI
jgi:hypothetical protein